LEKSDRHEVAVNVVQITASGSALNSLIGDGSFSWRVLQVHVRPFIFVCSHRFLSLFAAHLLHVYFISLDLEILPPSTLVDGRVLAG
jgi:hypothetical protein